MDWDGGSELMGWNWISLECCSVGPPVALNGRREHRIWAVLQPLLEQQSGGGAVKGTAAVAMETMALACCPGAGVLVYPGQGQLQPAGQALAVALAVQGLGGGLTRRIEWQAHHQGQHPPLLHQGVQVL
jgi:hypothetical protein